MGKSSITPKQARAFLDRWKLVSELGAGELRESSMEMRLRRLSALVGSRQLFDADPNRERRGEEVRKRWLRIRKTLDDSGDYAGAAGRFGQMDDGHTRPRNDCRRCRSIPSE